MDEIHIKAHAKINIALDVIGKRADGYHELKTIMQTLHLHDRVHLKKIFKPSYFKLICNKAGLPVDERNLAYRAADYMIKTFDINTGVFINLEKNIPISAGLAGGSSDCAAVLIGMRDLFDLPVSTAELVKIGKQFGADVPYCVTGGTMLAEGIGEKLTPLPKFPELYVLLATPSYAVSTARTFAEFHMEHRTEYIDYEMLINSLTNQDLAGICSQMKNTLESITICKHNLIAELKDEMLINGAIGSLMSGSGPTVFGLFKSIEARAVAATAIAQKFPQVKSIIKTKIYNPERRFPEFFCRLCHRSRMFRMCFGLRQCCHCQHQRF